MGSYGKWGQASQVQKIKINDIELDAGYGVFWGKKEQNLEYFQKLSKKVEFSEVEFISDNQIFYLRVKK